MSAVFLRSHFLNIPANGVSLIPMTKFHLSAAVLSPIAAAAFVLLPACKPAPAPSEAPSTPAPYAHSGFFGVTRLGKIISSQTNQSSDLHGFSRKNYQSQLGAFAFSQGPMFPLAFKLDTSRQAAIGAQLDLQVSSLTTSGTRERLVASDGTQDIVRNLTERSPNVTHNAGDIGGNIWLEIPLPAAWW
ncbi:MAG: hypothetical protein ACOYM3_29710, partial [Terrimicrobiaceae bacterium]